MLRKSRFLRQEQNWFSDMYRKARRGFYDKVDNFFGDQPYCPFGEEFGLKVYPEFMTPGDRQRFRTVVVDTYSRETDKVVVSDGRLQVPPVSPSAILPVLERLESRGAVPEGWLNNQTVNMYQPGNFIRAHIDNLFVYDDIFAVMSYGAPQIIKFVHAQNGEELQCVIPTNSVYTMQGPSRYIYFHMLLPVETQRLSIVLRRSMFNSHGTFGRPMPSPIGNIMPWKANQYVDVIMSKGVGSPKMDVDDNWLERENLGPFDTAKWVKTLRPLRDWSLQRQLEEDAAKLRDLKKKDYIDDDFSWRVAQLKENFKEMERRFAVSETALRKAAEVNAKQTQEWEEGLSSEFKASQK